MGFNLKYIHMNKNVNLTKILKNCPKGWEFYSDICGKVVFDHIDNVDSIDKNSPIWKLKRVLYEFLETLANKHIVLKKVGIQTEIEKYLYTKVVEKIINTIKTIYVNVNENKKYIDDSCKYYIYRINLNRQFQYLKNHLSNTLSHLIFPKYQANNHFCHSNSLFDYLQF